MNPRNTLDILQDPEAGFTLTEVLVSLTITALIASFLFGGLQWGSQALHVAEKTQNHTRLANVQSVIRRSIEDSRSKYEINNLGKRLSVFQGKNDELIFISPAPAQVMTPGLYRNQLRIDTEDPKALILKSVLFRPSLDANTLDPLEDAEAYTLIENIETLSIAYYGKHDGAEDGSWGNQWIDQARQPELIRINVEFPKADSRHWPELTIKTSETN